MIQLRHYQRRFVSEVHSALRECDRVLAVAPTGSGKRLIACWWATKIIEAGRRVMAVIDRQILIRQLADECKRKGIAYGILMGAEPRNDEAPLQICSIQTLERRAWTDKPHHVSWILIDEAHKATESYRRVMAEYEGVKVVGLTATPVGAAGRPLVPGTFQRLVEPVQNTELLREGWLLHTRVMCPFEPDIKGVTIGTDEYNQEQLGERVEKMTVHASIWPHWEPFSQRQTICFVPRLKFARGLAEQFTRRGYRAEVIEGATSPRDRQELFRKFESGDVRVLISVDVLREGFDMPIASVGIDLQPSKQLRSYWQKVGRVRRPYEGQRSAIWLDFAGNFWRHLHPDENPEWPTGEETAADCVRRAQKAKEPWSCPACSYTLAPWERLHDLKCPNCGHQMALAKRRIVMEDGRLRTVTARDKQKQKKSENELKVSKWLACLFRIGRTGGTLSRARWLYKHETGKWPDMDYLPHCPKTWESLDWKRKVADVYPQFAKKEKANADQL